MSVDCLIWPYTLHQVPDDRAVFSTLDWIDPTERPTPPMNFFSLPTELRQEILRLAVLDEARLEADRCNDTWDWIIAHHECKDEARRVISVLRLVEKRLWNNLYFVEEEAL